MGFVVKNSGWRIPDELLKRGLLKYDKLKGIDRSREKFKRHKLTL